jgi:hypothetical protein
LVLRRYGVQSIENHDSIPGQPPDEVAQHRIEFIRGEQRRVESRNPDEQLSGAILRSVQADIRDPPGDRSTNV